MKTRIKIRDYALNESKSDYNYVILLQPTSPLRTNFHIDQSIKLLFEKKADAILSLCIMEHNPLFSNPIPKDGSLNNFIAPEITKKRTQDLLPYYRLNGAIYLCERDRLIKEETFFLSDNIFAYVMNQKDSVEIDTRFDFDFAEYLMNNRSV